MIYEKSFETIMNHFIHSKNLLAEFQPPIKVATALSDATSGCFDVFMGMPVIFQAENKIRMFFSSFSTKYVVFRKISERGN